MTEGVHTMVGAYVLDALTDSERDDFETHLATCATCAVELAEFQETAARLGAAAETTAPAELKMKVLEAVARAPQDRPNVISMTSRSQFRRVLPAMVAAAAALALILSFTAYQSQHDQTQNLQAQQAEFGQVLSADDAQTQSYKLDGGGRLRLVSSENLGEAVIAMDQLPELPSNRAYQLWRIDAAGHAESAGLMRNQDLPQGAATSLLTDLQDTEKIAMTIEPESGSTAPTTDAIAIMRIV